MEEKRYKAAIMLPLRVLFAALSVFLVYQCVINPSRAELIDRAAMLVVAGLMAWIILGTYYELRADEAYFRCGPLALRIPYDDIVSVDTGFSLFTLNFAFAFKCVVIKRRLKRLSVAISPENPPQFMADLKARLPKS